jgi:hypothetical protein
MPGRQDTSIPGPQNEVYRAMAAAALQEIRDPPKQLHPPRQAQQPMQTQQMLFRLQSQQQQDQQQQQQLSIPPQQQQQPQHLQLPEVNGASMIPMSGSRPQSPMQLPSMRASSYTESDLHLSPAPSSTGSFGNPMQTMLGRTQQSNVIAGEDSSQFSGLLRTNQNAMQQTLMLPATSLPRDPQVSNQWFPALRDAKLTDAPGLSTGSRIGRADPSQASATSFIPPCDASQSGLAPLPIQSAPFTAFRDSKEQEQVQPDPRSHLLFGVSIDQPLVGPGGT